jgi:hypothetical protein
LGRRGREKENRKRGERKRESEKKKKSKIPENFTPSIHSAVKTLREVTSWWIFGTYTWRAKDLFRAISFVDQKITI